MDHQKRASRRRYWVAKRNVKNLPVVKLFKSRRGLYLQAVRDGHVLCEAHTLRDKEKTADVFCDKMVKNYSETKVCYDIGGFRYCGKIKILLDKVQDNFRRLSLD